jgi:hypothetical protein
MSLIYERNWGLFCVSYCLFARAVYRVFYTTVWVPYEAIPVLCVQREWEDGYKEDDDMTGKYSGIQMEWENRHIRMQKRPGNPPSYKGSEWMRSWWGCLLSWIRALPGYLLLWVTSTSHHHSLFNRRNYIALSAVTGVVPSDSKSMSRTGWPDVDVCQRWRQKRWRQR